MERFAFLFILSMISLGCSKMEINTEPSYDIAVLGGSIASRPESEQAKEFWSQNLKLTIKTYAEGGAGFAESPGRHPIPQQVDFTRSEKIYILWCSTNDYTKQVEENDKYSVNSQNGGMRITVRKIREKNPMAQIIVLGSLPSFDGRDLRRHVEGQMAVCQELNLPYLRQLDFFNSMNFTQYYKEDNVHIEDKGYIYIRKQQLDFLKQYLHVSHEEITGNDCIN